MGAEIRETKKHRSFKTKITSGGVGGHGWLKKSENNYVVFKESGLSDEALQINDDVGDFFSVIDNLLRILYKG